MSEAERGRKKRAKKSLFREQKRKLSRLDYENIIVETIDPDNPADGIMESLEEHMSRNIRSVRMYRMQQMCCERERGTATARCGVGASDGRSEIRSPLDIVWEGENSL